MAKLQLRKGVTKNKKQREAKAVNKAAAELAGLSAKRKAHAGSSKPTHVPQPLGRGGVRSKIDTDKVSPNSKKKIEKQRGYVAKHRLKRLGEPEKVSDAVLADPTEAWRKKVTGHTNKYPERARQHAAAKLAAAMPKNKALHGPALAAFSQNPTGKRAFAAISKEVPDKASKKAKRLDALETFLGDIGVGIDQMKAQA
eukprot:4843126-Prymnesium_polylepis.1